MTTHT